MTNQELRAKYGDFTKTNNFEYPPHFFSPKDDFTANIPLWKTMMSRFDSRENLLFLEIGTGHGRSAVWLLENILTDLSSKIITIDIQNTRNYKRGDLPFDFGDELTLTLDQNLQPYIDKNQCELYEMDSKTFLKKLFGGNLNSKLITNDSNKFDFIYLDGCHDPDYVMFESAVCFDMLKPAGFLLFDDYGWGNCKFGIDAFLLCYKNKINLLLKEWLVLVEKL